MLKPRKLKTVSMAVNAPAELTYQVVASAGRLVEDQGEVKIVDFETQVGDRKLVTRERVRLDPPRRVEYEWLRGPLPHVVEEIEIRPEGANSRLIYRGEASGQKPPLSPSPGSTLIEIVFRFRHSAKVVASVLADLLGPAFLELHSQSVRHSVHVVEVSNHLIGIDDVTVREIKISKRGKIQLFYLPWINRQLQCVLAKSPHSRR